MREPARIVFLVDSLVRGGVQSGLELCASRLDPARFAAEVWVVRGGDSNWAMREDFERAGVRLRFAPVRGVSDRDGILDLARLVVSERVDLVSTHNFLPNLVGRVAAAMAGEVAIVANYHQTYETYWESKFVAFERELRGATDRFICVSRAVRDYVTPLLGLPESRVRLLYNGFDVQRFSSVAAARDEAREVLGLAPGRPLVGFVGRLAPVKDIPTFVRAMPRIVDQVPGVQFALAGGGEERVSLEGLVADIGMRDRVRFLGPRDDIPRVMAALDCMVLPSRVEGFGRVVVEAFAARTPVVATMAGALPELVRDGANGLLFPIGDSDALAQCVIATLQRPEETGERVARAFEDAKRYDVPEWIRGTEGVFEEALSRRRAMSSGRSVSGGVLRWRYRRFRIRCLWRRLWERAPA